MDLTSGYCDTPCDNSNESDVKATRIIGSVLALALGDAFGAPYEGGILERAVWALIGKKNGKRRWTDDTRMTVDVMESLIECGGIDQNDLARRFAQSYQWSRGYGPGTAKVLKRIRRGQPWEMASRSVYRDGSFGNGGAMRAPVVGLFFGADNEDELVDAAHASAAVTHGHALAIEGAVLIALATALAYNDASSPEIIERMCQRAESPEFLNRLHTASIWIQEGGNIAAQTVAAELGNGMAAADSRVTAVYVALTFRGRPFDELMEFAIKIRGDVDTIAAMACGIWGALRGLHALPQTRLEQLEKCDYLRAMARSLAEAVSNRKASRCR